VFQIINRDVEAVKTTSCFLIRVLNADSMCISSIVRVFLFLIFFLLFICDLIYSFIFVYLLT